MNKQKKVDCKKTIVRTTQKPVAKIKVTVEQSKSVANSSGSGSTGVKKKPSKPVEKRCEVSETNLDLPQLYSTLRISKEIDNIVKPRTTKSVSDVEKKLTVDEKVTRKVNFRYDQPVYKGLIPLTSNEEILTPPLHIRTPRSRKDEDSVLSDLLTPWESRQDCYCYIPTSQFSRRWN